MKTKHELKDDLENIAKQRSDLLKTLEKLQKRFAEISELIMEQDPEYVKVECVECSGKGYVQLDDKKQLCEVCQGRQYIWLKKYEE